MKTTKSLCGMLAMLALTACTSNSDDAVGNAPQLWDVTLQASMGDAANSRRALSVDGNVITASFEVNDEVVGKYRRYSKNY